MARLTIKNLTKKYDDEKTDYLAVNHLNLECRDGEFVGILGPSGCGKTTTLRMIAGLERVTGGEIYVEDKRIDNLLPKDRNIGLAFEDYALYPPLNVYDNVSFNLKAKKVSSDVIKQKMDRIASLLSIEDILKLKPAALSGGQKQRVNMARALIREPAILLLDEPMSHLDGKMRQQMRVEIKRLHKEIKCTTIIVTHDQLEAMTLADRIAIMSSGVLQQFDTPAEVYDNPVNEFVASFIGDPPMNIFETDIAKGDSGMFFVFTGSDVKLKVPDKYKDILSSRTKVKLGIRPTDVHINDEDGSTVKISTFENLGDERRISIKITEDQYLALISAENINYNADDNIKISFNNDRMHIFDIESGKRLNA